MTEKRKIAKSLKARARSFKGTALKVVGKHIEALNIDSLSKTLEAGKASYEAEHLKALFLTPSGIIIGSYPELRKLSKKSLGGSFFDSFNVEVERMEQETTGVMKLTSGGAVPLVDVSIKTNFGQILHFKEFLLFTEDVVGAYYVPKDYKFE